MIGGLKGIVEALICFSYHRDIDLYIGRKSCLVRNKFTFKSPCKLPECESFWERGLYEGPSHGQNIIMIRHQVVNTFGRDHLGVGYQSTDSGSSLKLESLQTL